MPSDRFVRLSFLPENLALDRVVPNGWPSLAGIDHGELNPHPAPILDI